MKKMISAIFLFSAVVLSFGIAFNVANPSIKAYATVCSTNNCDENDLCDSESCEVAKEESSELNITARAALLVDYGSGTILYSKNEKQRYPIASMCKIMTLVLIYQEMEKGTFTESDTIKISPEAAGMGGSQIFLSANGNYKISDLIKGIVVSSANDASVAMAELIAGSEEGFVKMMNAKAEELGMQNTRFSNCTGLPRPEQYSCAEDVATMTRVLLQNKGYYNYSRIWMDKLIHDGGSESELTNTNKLIRFYNGCDGGKTGYTSEAKHCVSATAIRNGMRLISVIIGADNSKVRFAEASRMLNHGFGAYTSKQIASTDTVVGAKAMVRGGKIKEIDLLPTENYSVLTPRANANTYKIDYQIPQFVKAPIKKGDVLGTMLVVLDGKIIKEIPLASACDVNRSGLTDSLFDIIRNW